MKYTDELLDPKWRRKRMTILKRDGFKCTVCGSKKELSVHHTYYKNGAKPWNYPSKALLTLCQDCHYKFHTEHETPIRGKMKSKKLKMKIKHPKKKIPIESKEPRYRKKINGEW
mgnify:FL=1